MKYKIHILVILSISLLFLSMQNVSKNAVVKFVVGKVEFQPGKQTVWRPVRLNAKLSEGDRIKTALNSRVELNMPDGSVLKINENTIFDINELKDPENDQEDKMSFTLWAGKMWASFKKIVTERQERVIESPSAVVAIRGTTLQMEVDLKQKTNVKVIQGLVSVKSKQVQGEVLVSSNQQTSVESGQVPAQPTEYIPEVDEGEEGDEIGGAPLTETFSFNMNLNQFVFTDPTVLVAGVSVTGKVPPGTNLTVDGVPVPVASNGDYTMQLRVTEGLNALQVSATWQGTTQNRTVRLYVNTSKPEIRLTTPVVSGFVNRRDYSLSGGVFDPTPQDKINVYINNEQVLETEGTGSFNRTVILEEGANTIAVRAVDRSGNTTEVAQNIFLDTVNPILTITDPPQTDFVRYEPPPPPNTIINRLEQTIRGVVIDPEPSSGIKRIQINGKEIQPNSDGTFETVIFIERGINRLNFVVEDLAGNILSDNSRSIRVPR